MNREKNPPEHEPSDACATASYAHLATITTHVEEALQAVRHVNATLAAVAAGLRRELEELSK